MFRGSNFIAWSLRLKKENTVERTYQYNERNKVRIFGNYQNPGGRLIQNLSQRGIFYMSELF